METMNWLAFGSTSSLTNTLVHFYPSAGNITAPYPTLCKLGIFSEGNQPQSVTLEGARLSQPDGVRLSDAFPELEAGMFGIEISLSAQQQRIELTNSKCIVEFFSPTHSVRYYPASVSHDTEKTLDQNQHFLAAKDSYLTSAVVMVNSGHKELTANLEVINSFKPDSEISTDKKSLTIPAYSVIEHVVEDNAFESVQASEQSWGLMRATTARLNGIDSNKLHAYLVYKDAITKRPVSVKAL